MSSIFEYVNKNMVKKLGGKDLRPVKCLLDATKFRQLNVLRKNSQSRFWEKPHDDPVGFSLMDILEPSSSAPETVVLGTYLFSDIMAQKREIGGDISAGVEGSVSGNFARFHGPTLEFQAVSIPDPKLEILQNRKLLSPEPTFLKECRMRGDNLYVVTEAIELTKDTVLQDDSSVDTLGKLSSPWNTYVKGKVWGKSLKARETKLSVPQGTVLAYRKKQLVIKEQGSGGQKGAGEPTSGFIKQSFSASLSCPSSLGSDSGLATDSWREKFTYTIENIETGRKISPISPIGRIEEPFYQDFQVLQEEVSHNTTLLAQLSKDVQAVIFHSILSLLEDREALCGLMTMLELDSLGQMDGPGGRILDELQRGSRPPWVDLKSLMLYLLQALMVLSDTQLDMLAQSMEKRILHHQRELGEGLAITYGLLEECGLKVKVKNSKPTWDLEAKMPMSALYGTLSLLQQLAED